MTREEALILLGLASFDLDEIEDAWDEALFKEKQFFITNTPIKKVFQKHLERLENLEKAYQFLTERKFATELSTIPDLTPNPSFDEILNFQASIKTRLVNANNLQSVKYFVERLLFAESKYCLFIYNLFIEDFNQKTLPNIPLSQKPDIMDIKSVVSTYQEKQQKELTSIEFQIIENEFSRVKKWLEF